MRILLTSPKTPVNDIDNHVLLLRGHLVVARKAEAAIEQIGAHVSSRLASDISVGGRATVALPRHERVHAVDGLLVHRLPHRTALCVHAANGLENLRGTALVGLGHVESFTLSPHLRAHSVFVNEQAAQPVVGLAVMRVKRVHDHRQACKGLCIALEDGFLLRDMLLQVGQLTTDNPGNDVGHAVVVAQLFVLVPRSVLARLRGPLASTVSFFLGVAEDAAAGAAGHDLVAVEANDAPIAQAARGLALVGGTEGLGCVLDDHGIVRVADGADLGHLCRGAVEVHEDHDLNFGVQLEGHLERFRIHVPGVTLGVYVDGGATLVDYGVYCGVEGHVGADDFLAVKAAANAGPDTGGGAVDLAGCELDGEVEGCGAGAEGYCIGDTAELCYLTLNLVDVGAYCGHPVGLVGFGHPAEFVTVHGGAGEPELAGEGG